MSDTLPPLRDVLRAHGLEPKKNLGQNFLLDLNLTARIARTAGALAGHTVLEIGPGPGGLTRALIAEGAERIIAVERDDRCLAALEEVSAAYPGRLQIVAADALALDPRPYLGDGPIRIVANLPYNIATPLLVGWLSLSPWPGWWTSMTLMFQREVAERISAPPGSKTYGRLSVLAQWRTKPRLMFDVHPSSFVPPPKVVSSIVNFTPIETPYPCRQKDLEAVTAAAFGQRRKMLRQSLKGLSLPPQDLLEAAGVPETARAEEVPVIGFCKMAERLATARDGA